MTVTATEGASPVDRSLDTYGLFTLAAIQNPYPVYEALRSEDPVRWSEQANAWVITTYADTWTIQGRPDLSVSRREEHLSYLPEDYDPEYQVVLEHFSRWLLYMDGAGHDRLKRLFLKAFTPAAVNRLRPMIGDTASQLLDRLARDGEIDVVRDVAQRIPLAVICRLLGVPLSDFPLLVDWTNRLGAWLFQGVGIDKRATTEDCYQALMEQRDYFERALDKRRTQPQDDLMTAMIRAEEAGDRMSYEEIHSTCTLLTLAGNLTSTSLISSSIYYLRKFPSEIERLRANPDLVVNAVEELLRFEAPTQRGIRTALADFELAGRQIRQGDLLHVMIGAANRDPARFADPDRLDLTRSDIKHTSLGHGMHFCLGAHLARMEAQIAIQTVLERFPEYRLADEEAEPPWMNMNAFRCIAELVIRPEP